MTAAVTATAMIAITTIWMMCAVPPVPPYPTIAAGSRPMMPTKMISDTPLPTPYSVISSPSHMAMIVPAVSVRMMLISVAALGLEMIGPVLGLVNSARYPNAWSMASGTVSQRV